VVTPGRFEEETFRVPQGATVVDRDDLDTRPFAIVTQALKEEAGVLAQQTTASQGSPILRGFTGQRNVYLIDGVRYNTAAWRDGPSQPISITLKSCAVPRRRSTAVMRSAAPWQCSA
jgi:hemoglobin/transferrin/lactoferrin receptor protein